MPSNKPSGLPYGCDVTTIQSVPGCGWEGNKNRNTVGGVSSGLQEPTNQRRLCFLGGGGS